jgi:hypothetical protein
LAQLEPGQAIGWPRPIGRNLAISDNER